MRVSKEQAAENRARILAETARMIREAGIGGVGVDALTQAAGLTHGSLYSQFGSKERLVAEALAEALDNSGDKDVRKDLAPGGGLCTVVARYLSARHRDAPGRLRLGRHRPRGAAPGRRCGAPSPPGCRASPAASRGCCPRGGAAAGGRGAGRRRAGRRADPGAGGGRPGTLGPHPRRHHGAADGGRRHRPADPTFPLTAPPRNRTARMLSHLLAPALARRGVHYGWVMVALTFLVSLSSAGALGILGALLLPLQRDFGWDTGAISGALALRLLLFGLMAPFAAALLQRYGLRRTVAAALALVVLGVLLSMGMTEVWQLWLSWGVLTGVGTGMTALVLGATVANRWFAQRRGLVLGILTAARRRQRIQRPSACTISCVTFLASPKSIMVFGRKNSSLSTPAYPEDMPRLTKDTGLGPLPRRGSACRRSRWSCRLATGLVRRYGGQHMY